MKLFSSAILLLILISCNEESYPPYAQIESFPLIGDSTTLFEFNSDGSYDKKGNGLALQYRWDFNGDLIWDTDYSYETKYVKRFPIPGTYYISVEVINNNGLTAVAGDSIIVFGMNKDTSTLIDPRDGKSYQIVKINEMWWMAESLQYGVVIDPLVVEMTNNQIDERYLVYDIFKQDTFSVYSFYEAIKYDLHHEQGICPDGWHIPTENEWRSLFNNYPLEYAVKYYGENGLSGLHLEKGASPYRWHDPDMPFHSLGEARYWSSTYFTDNLDVFHAGAMSFNESGSFDFGYIGKNHLTGMESRAQYLGTIRCVKNHK